MRRKGKSEKSSQKMKKKFAENNFIFTFASAFRDRLVMKEKAKKVLKKMRKNLQKTI